MLETTSKEGYQSNSKDLYLSILKATYTMDLLYLKVNACIVNYL